jgi:hypothetical protein
MLNLNRLTNSAVTAGLRVVKKSTARLPARLRPRFSESSENLLELASKATGLDDFGDPEFLPHYHSLIEAFREEAELNVCGVVAAKRDVLNLLSGRLRLQEQLTSYPEIHEEPIEQPLIIIGLPRAATTYLHGLLALDAANRAPRNWEIMCPFPRPGSNARTDRANIGKAARGLWFFHRLTGNLHGKHRLAARSPQEDIVIMSYAFQSIRFDSVYRLPQFQARQEKLDNTQAYRWHKKFLQHLQFGRPVKRWVLKAPAHLLSLESLLRVYPDARLVQINRDPAEFLPSVIGLTATMQSSFSITRAREPLVNQVISRWQNTLNELTAKRSRLGLSDNRILDLSYREVTDKPIATLEKIYSWMGWELSVDIKNTPVLQQSKRYTFQHSLSEIGIEVDDLHERFSDYIKTYLDSSCSSTGKHLVER